MAKRRRLAVRYAVVMGYLLRVHREGLGMPQGEHARKLGVSQGTLSRLESGTQHMTVIQLCEHAAALRLTASDLIRQVEALADQLRRNRIRVLTKGDDLADNETEINASELAAGLGLFWGAGA